MKYDLKTISRNALYTALYVALCKVFDYISFGAIQVRIAEALCIMPIFDDMAIISVTLGCFISNLLFSSIYDAIFGTLATFIGLVFIKFIKSEKLQIRIKDFKISIDPFFIKMLPTILSNAIIIPFVIKFAFGDTMPIWLIAITVALGEIVAVYILGYSLYRALKVTNIFENNKGTT